MCRMTQRHIVPAGGGAGLRLARGQQLRLIDTEGGQTGDLMAFSADGRERLSNGRTFDYDGPRNCGVGVSRRLVQRRPAAAARLRK